MRRFAFFLLLMSCVLFPMQVTYGKEYEDTSIKPREEAVLAFFHAAGKAPDYDEWIRSSNWFHTIPSDEVREKYFFQESLRLGRGFSQFDIERDLLEIKTGIVARYVEPEEGEETPRLMFWFVDLGPEKIPTFNYAFGRNIISLVVEQLLGFSDMSLSEANDRIVRRLVPSVNKDFDAQLEIHVRVTKADYDHPVEELASIKQWLMFGKIGYLKCYYQDDVKGRDVVLWEYLAPWYKKVFEFKNLPEDEKYPHPYDLYKD